MVKYQQLNLHDEYMVIHCTTLSRFLYIMKFIIIKMEKKKNKRHTGCFALDNSSLPYHHHGELLFYKTLLLVIHTHNFPRGTVSLLTQKLFMVSQIPTAPTSQHTQALHVYQRLGFSSVCLFLSSLFSQGMEEERQKESIKLHIVFLYCVYHQTSCKSTRERKYQAVSNF